MLERAMDLLAVELAMDPAELRRRNLIQPDQFPHQTVAGAPYDSGDYPAALEAALKLAGYEQLRREQAQRRARGDRLQLGVGLATYVEITGGGPAFKEFGAVEVDQTGSVTVRAGTSAHGQGHETSFAQITAEVLGVPMEAIRVVESDTAEVPRGVGTFGSRSVQLGGSAVHAASVSVLEEGRRQAADLLEANPADIVVVRGRGLGVAGAPQSVVSWADLARAAGPDGLRVALDQEQAGPTFPFGCHVAVVEVDVETGDARLTRHVAVDDSGRIVNPLLADGQVQGGIAQGVAQALYEEVAYDADGSPRTATLVDYQIPTVGEMPEMVLGRTVTPTPLNALGAKGIGESGTIGSTPAVQNAVVDAVSHLGIRHIDMPLTPERVWRAIQGL
jgi:carbon-monoxide dehydrogenase large subunit